MALAWLQRTWWKSCGVLLHQVTEQLARQAWILVAASLLTAVQQEVTPHAQPHRTNIHTHNDTQCSTHYTQYMAYMHPTDSCWRVRRR